MKCHHCNFDNRPGARFCKNCGKPLVSKTQRTKSASNHCSNCGSANPIGARFCKQCGSSLLASNQAATAGHCPNCGNQNSSKARYCKNCGFALAKEVSRPALKHSLPQTSALAGKQEFEGQNQSGRSAAGAKGKTIRLSALSNTLIIGIGASILCLFVFIAPYSRIFPISPILEGPLVIIRQPVSNSTAYVNHPMMIIADALDPDGIVRMELWADDQLVQYEVVESSSQYQFMGSWVPAAEGSHSLFVRSYNQKQEVNQSNLIAVDVTPLSYIVDAGDTLESIADATSLDTAALIEMNPQLLSPAPYTDIPIGTIPDGEGERPIVYSAQPGDTWEDVANAANEVASFLPDGTAINLAPLPTGEIRAPEPGESLYLPSGDSGALEGFVPPEFSNLPPRVDMLTAENKNCSILLKWRNPDSDLRQIRIYGRSPGSAQMKLIRQGEPGSETFEFDAQLFGEWTFYVASVGQSGNENLASVIFDNSKCATAGLGDGLTPIQLMFTKIDVPVDKMYCYITISTGNVNLPYARIPVDPFEYIVPTDLLDVSGDSRTAIYVSQRSSSQAVDMRAAAESAFQAQMAYKAKVVSNPPRTVEFYAEAEKVLIAELNCYGWKGGEHVGLGTGVINHQWQELDGRTLSLSLSNSRVEYRLLPSSWSQPGGERVTDSRIPAPTNVRQGTFTFVRTPGELGGAYQSTLQWDWEPNVPTAGPSVAGFQIVLRIQNLDGTFTDTTIDEVTGSDKRRSGAWPQAGQYPCGVRTQLLVRAFGYGPYVSSFSAPLDLDARACTEAELQAFSSRRIHYGETVGGQVQGNNSATKSTALWIFEGNKNDEISLGVKGTNADLTVWIQPVDAQMQWWKPAAWTTPEPQSLTLPGTGEYAIFVQTRFQEYPVFYNLELLLESRPPTIQSVVIFAHGVMNIADGAESASRSYQEFRSQLIELVDWRTVGTDAGTVYTIDFYCCYMTAWNASGTIGSRSAANLDNPLMMEDFELWGLSHDGWMGVAKLKQVVAETRRIFGPDVPITILSHSQGTVITLAALQEGMVVDNWILMGSPLNQTAVAAGLLNTNFYLAALNVRGTILNLWSMEDGTVSGLKCGIGGWCLGREVQMLLILAFTNNIEDQQVIAVDHTGPDGWWEGYWLFDDRIFIDDGFPVKVREIPKDTNKPARDRVVELLLANPEPIVISQAQLAEYYKLRTYAVKNLRATWDDPFTSEDTDWYSSSENREDTALTFLSLTQDTLQGIYFDDKDWASYQIFCSSDQISARIVEAVWFDFDHGLPWQKVSSNSRTAEACAKVSSSLYDATLWLQLRSTDPSVAQCFVYFKGRDKYPFFDSYPDGCVETDPIDN